MEFDFPDSVDGEKAGTIPTQFRSLYVEGEGGSLTLDKEKFGGVAEAVNGLNQSLKAARAEAKQHKSKAVDLSPLSEFGEDPAAIRSAIDEKINELTKQAAKGKDIDPEKIKADLAKGFQKEREQLDQRNTALTGQLYKLMVQNEATSAISEAKGVPELLMPFVERQTKTVEEDGKFLVHVVDAQGDIRYSGVTGQPMSIKELIAEMKGDERFGRLFESDVQDGGGGGNNNHTRRPPAPAGKNLSPTEKIAAGLGKNTRR